ncbi:kinase-like protein [Cadophora sp. DSE1049]|nr:kinase-like protein [Cadophora sp. DSE1049]
MWMITEYCGGGSVATLMKPTAPGGLQEKWIIPIVREVAEAIKWVHDAGIIHRDIKCANILVTELGGVQLCDFGVAGTLETKLDKRSTFIGTLHWMAPELFNSNPSYGKEVDIWAFGCTIFEIATGLPPNVNIGVPLGHIGPHSAFHVPRLEGDNYSNGLRGILAYCLEELPSLRPKIEEVQKQSYIWGTKSRYPTSSLVHLVRAFKMWEGHVGSRESLFMQGGAQGQGDASLPSMADDEWNFSNTISFDQEVSSQSTPQDVYDAYGNTSELQDLFSRDTTQPRFQKPSRRRPPPHALARLRAPLENIFNPNILSSYEDNSRNHYGRPSQQLASDLPLRDEVFQSSIKDTMIDLDAHDFETVKANRSASKDGTEEESDLTLHDFSHSTLSDPAEINIHRRTQDWKFPAI